MDATKQRSYKKKLVDEVDRFTEAIAKDDLEQNNALLKFHYPNINIDELSDTDWCALLAEMWFVLKAEIFDNKK